MGTRRGNNEGSIRLRSDGRWEARASAGIDYRTGQLKRISVYGKTKTEVIEKLRKLEYDIHCKKSIDPTSTTLTNWMTYWLETYKKSNIKQSTYVSYRTYINKHIAIGFPKMKLKDVTTRNLQEFYAYKLEVEGLAPKTLINLHRCLHEALKQAVLEHYIPFNPSDAVVLPKVEKPEIEILTPEEQNKLFQASYNFRYGIFIRLTLSTGLRLGEVLGLKWKNIDFHTGVLSVRQTLNRLEKIDYNGTGNKTEIVIQTPKTKNSLRSIPLLPFIIQELKDWRNMQLADKAIAGNNYTDMGLIVTNPLGGYIEPRTFKDYYNQMLEAANIGHYTFHALRHTFCTRALENDMDAKTVSTIMGHYSVAFTLDVYAHVLDSHKREEMMKIQGIFSQQEIPEHQTYPIIVTPTANGFILNVVDFDDLTYEVDNVSFGISCACDAIKALTNGYLPEPTPFTDLMLDANEFLTMVNV